jgi:hypothetical protein
VFFFSFFSPTHPVTLHAIGALVGDDWPNAVATILLKNPKKLIYFNSILFQKYF